MKTKLKKSDYINLLDWSLRHYSARDDLLLAVKNGNSIPIYKEWKMNYSFDVCKSIEAFEHVKEIVNYNIPDETCDKCGCVISCGNPDPCMGKIKYVSHGCCGHSEDGGYLFFSDRDLAIRFVNEPNITHDILPDDYSGMVVYVSLPITEKSLVLAMIEESFNYQQFKKKFFNTYDLTN